MNMAVKKHLLSSIALALMLSAISAKAFPYGDDNNDIYSNDDYDSPGGAVPYENVIYTLPKFTSKSRNELVNEGGTIRLPCIVDKLEGFVMIWNKDGNILAVGEQVVAQDNRVKLIKEVNGYTLTINLAEETDAGNYSCQISTFKPTDLHHQVRIRTKPEVRPIPENGILTPRSGDSVTLACQVTKGDPQPEVKWHRRERKMPSGEDFIRGTSFTYTSVTRHHSGNYICEADNGFGMPSETLLKLDVQHAPEIEQEETFIHTGEGVDTEVICVVHASPRAKVTWIKNGVEAITEGQVEYSVSHHGNRHKLRIPRVSEAEFGDYTCRAENELGKAEATTRVSGKAGDVTFKSDPKGADYSSYNLEWNAQSSTPITQFKLQYKSEDDIQWNDSEVDAVNVDGDFYAGDFTTSNLRPATVYVARVASLNAYGYNDFGAPFKFATKGADPLHAPMSAGVCTSQEFMPKMLTISTLAVVLASASTSKILL